MAYLLSEQNVDRLLEALRRAHGKAVASPFWPMAKDQPEVMEIINAAAAVESETRKNREVAPNVNAIPKPLPQ